MTEDQIKQHGGYRPGAGRKPSLKPLSIIRLRDPHIRAALIAVTAHQRQLSGNPQRSQEQVVADLILAAQRQLEKSNNQELHLPTHPDAPATTSLENINNQDTLPQAPLVSATTGSLENTTNQITYEDQLFAPATVITTLRREITPLVATLRTKRAVGQRDGKRLIALLTQLITLHAALITPWAILGLKRTAPRKIAANIRADEYHRSNGHTDETFHIFYAPLQSFIQCTSRW